MKFVILCVFNFILGCKINTNMKNYDGKDYFENKYLPLINAIDNDDELSLNNLINKDNINVIGRNNITFLYYCFLKDKKKAFTLLISKGANPNIAFEDSDANFNNMINVATELDDNFYFDILVKVANLNVKDERGLFPIHNAIMVNNNKRVIKLLEHGANINSQDKNGKTPIYMLCVLNDFEFAYELILKGADTKIPNNMGASVALIIQESKFPITTKAYKWQQKIKEELIKQGIKFPVKRLWEK